MRTAGIREVRQNLSALLREVRKGREIVITDRGEPVARWRRRRKGRRGRSRTWRRFAAACRGSILRSRRRWLRIVPTASEAAAPAGPLYCDASALAKLVLPETGSDELDAAVAGRDDLLVSDLAVTEVASALGRRVREASWRRRSRSASTARSWRSSAKVPFAA